MAYGSQPWHMGSSWIRDGTHVSCIGRQILYCGTTGEALICLMCGSLYVSIPHPNLLLPAFPFPFGNYRFGFYICESVSVLQYIHLYYLLGSRYKCYHIVFVFL